MLGKKLIKLRTAKGLTQEELAKQLHISRATYAQYEIDRRAPDYETLKTIASFFRVSIDGLLDHVNFDEIIKEGSLDYVSQGRSVDTKPFFSYLLVVC